MPDSPDSVTSWRLGELERGFRDMRGELKEAVGTLGGGLTALQTQLSSYQTNISDKYVSRRDFEAFQHKIEEEMAERSEWGWKVWSLVVASFAALISLITLIMQIR